MSDTLYPKPTKALADKRRDLAPDAEAAFRVFSEAVFKDGALPRKTKQLIAVSVAHVTQCPYCIQGHTKAATREGATPQEIMEAIWVAAKCAPAAHSPILALATLEDLNVSRKQSG
jgi:AhpD family alkylhydroperoxidase